jgi:magnesium transporter
MIKIYHKTIKDRELGEIADFRVGSWIYAENPTEEELQKIASDFSLDAGLLKDAVDPYEVPRFEINKGTLFLFTRAPFQEQNGRVSTLPLLIAMGSNFVLTISQIHFPFFKKFEENKMEFTTTQKTKLLIQFFSEIIASYNNFLTNINRSVRSVSVKVENINNQNIIQFVTFEGIINDFLSDLIPTSAILNNLISATSSGRFLELYEEDKDLIEDLSLGSNQLIELCRATLKTIVNIREAYSTIMTNNLNRVIKFFTALTIIMTIPMIISSFYGMNIHLPLSKHPLAFWGIAAGTIIIVFTLLVIFIKKRWL